MIKPENIPDDQWEVFEITPLYRRSRHWIDREAGSYVQRTEFLADDQIQALNAEERASRDGKRWSAGAGSEKGGNVPMIRVARTPLNKFFADLAPRLKVGDQDYMRWWLQQDKNQPFRTKSGRV